MHLVLMGMRGVGKSTLARKLGPRMRRPVIDLDDRTAALLGCATAAQAWSKAGGERGFREVEAVALREALTSRPAAVIALGGGSPLAPGAFQLLQGARATGAIHILLLEATLPLLKGYISLDPDLRPSLTGRKSPVSEVEEVLSIRTPIYEALADDVLEVCGEVPTFTLQDLEYVDYVFNLATAGRRNA